MKNNEVRRDEPQNPSGIEVKMFISPFCAWEALRYESASSAWLWVKILCWAQLFLSSRLPWPLFFYRLSTQHVRVFCITVLWFLNFERKRSFLRDFREIMYLFTWASSVHNAEKASQTLQLKLFMWSKCICLHILALMQYEYILTFVKCFNVTHIFLAAIEAAHNYQACPFQFLFVSACKNCVWLNVPNL